MKYDTNSFLPQLWGMAFVMVLQLTMTSVSSSIMKCLLLLVLCRSPEWCWAQGAALPRPDLGGDTTLSLQSDTRTLNYVVSLHHISGSVVTPLKLNRGSSALETGVEWCHPSHLPKVAPSWGRAWTNLPQRMGLVGAAPRTAGVPPEVAVLL